MWKQILIGFPAIGVRKLMVFDFDTQVGELQVAVVVIQLQRADARRVRSIR
jgi:hypothetical protein